MKPSTCHFAWNSFPPLKLTKDLQYSFHLCSKYVFWGRINLVGKIVFRTYSYLDSLDSQYLQNLLFEIETLHIILNLLALHNMTLNITVVTKCN